MLDKLNFSIFKYLLVHLFKIYILLYKMYNKYIEVIKNNINHNLMLNTYNNDNIHIEIKKINTLP